MKLGVLVPLESTKGINFDPANLILYGKANPVDALDIIGKYVRDILDAKAFLETLI